MGICVYWQDEAQGILRYDCEGFWTWGELRAAFEQAVTMGQSVPYRVDVIVDITRTRGFPGGALNEVKWIADHQVENAGLSVIVSDNYVVRMLHETARRVSRPIARYFRLVETVTLAHEVIAESRAAVPPQQQPSH